MCLTSQGETQSDELSEKVPHAFPFRIASRGGKSRVLAKVIHTTQLAASYPLHNMSWFTHRDPFQSFFNSGYADDDAAWPFSNEYARRRQAPNTQQIAAQKQRQRMLEEQEQQRALELEHQQLVLQQERQRRLLEQQQQQRQQYAGHPYMNRAHYPYRRAAPPAARSPLYEQYPYHARQSHDDNMQDDSFLDQVPHMKRQPQYHRSSFEKMLEKNQHEQLPVLQEIPAPKRKSPAKRLRGTSAGQKRGPKRKKNRIATAAKPAQEETAPQPMRTEEIAVPSRVEKRRSPNRMRTSRRIPIMDSSGEDSQSPAEVARQLHHHEPAFSLRKMTEEDQLKKMRSHHVEHDEMSDASQETEGLLEETHAPSAADRLRTIMADQTEVEKEHQKHRHTLPDELPEPEYTPQDHLSSEEEDMDEDQETEEQPVASQAKQQGMSLEDIQTISQIRELNKQAQSIKIPKLSEVTRLRDLLTPEELLTQTLLNLDNLTVSNFSRPFRKQVIHFIQQQLTKVDDLKKEFKSHNPV